MLQFEDIAILSYLKPFSNKVSRTLKRLFIRCVSTVCVKKICKKESRFPQKRCRFFFYFFMSARWTWQLGAITQEFELLDSLQLERLFTQKDLTPISVTLKTPNNKVVITVENCNLNVMYVIIGPYLLLLSRKRTRESILDGGSVSFWTSLQQWFSYASCDAELVCDAWYYKRSSTAFTRGNMRYMVLLSNQQVAYQHNFADHKTRALFINPPRIRE